MSKYFDHKSVMSRSKQRVNFVETSGFIDSGLGVWLAEQVIEPELSIAQRINFDRNFFLPFPVEVFFLPFSWSLSQVHKQAHVQLKPDITVVYIADTKSQHWK